MKGDFFWFVANKAKITVSVDSIIVEIPGNSYLTHQGSAPGNPLAYQYALGIL